MCCFSAKHAALRKKSKDWLARNQNNVSEWSDMSTHGLLFQCASTIKIQPSVLVQNKADVIELLTIRIPICFVIRKPICFVIRIPICFVIRIPICFVIWMPICFTITIPMWLFYRRVFFVVVYFMFFYNIFLGLVSCLLRIIKAMALGTLFLPRLDHSTLPRKFQWFDPGN